MAEWLKHSTANQKVAGSSATIAIGDFFFSPVEVAMVLDTCT